MDKKLKAFYWVAGVASVGVIINDFIQIRKMGKEDRKRI
jgi:hypothetical protein